MKNEDDLLTAPSGIYPRHWTDRDAGSVNYGFVQALGFEHDLIGTGIDLARRRRAMRMLDVGAGTGRAVLELAEAISFQGQVPRNRISTLAVNDADFSQESIWTKVRQHYRRHPGDYKVMRGEDVSPRLGLFDLVCSFEVLLHSDRPDRLIRAMGSVLAQGGSLFFNVATANRQHQDGRVRQELRTLERRGCKVIQGTHTHRNFGRAESRAFYQVIAPEA